MGRLINPESAGKERARLSKAVVLAIRELGRGESSNNEMRDLTAFIVLALKAIAATIDISVAAWEKRNYWLKADRFRMEWSWTAVLAERLQRALLSEDWGEAAGAIAQIGQRLSKVEVSEKHRLGRPWAGAWNELNAKPPAK